MSNPVCMIGSDEEDEDGNLEEREPNAEKTNNEILPLGEVVYLSEDTSCFQPEEEEIIDRPIPVVYMTATSDGEDDSDVKIVGGSGRKRGGRRSLNNRNKRGRLNDGSQVVDYVHDLTSEMDPFADTPKPELVLGLAEAPVLDNEPTVTVSLEKLKIEPTEETAYLENVKIEPTEVVSLENVKIELVPETAPPQTHTEPIKPSEVRRTLRRPKENQRYIENSSKNQQNTKKISENQSNLKKQSENQLMQSKHSKNEQNEKKNSEDKQNKPKSSENQQNQPKPSENQQNQPKPRENQQNQPKSSENQQNQPKPGENQQNQTETSTMENPSHVKKSAPSTDKASALMPPPMKRGNSLGNNSRKAKYARQSTPICDAIMKEYSRRQRLMKCHGGKGTPDLSDLPIQDILKKAKTDTVQGTKKDGKKESVQETMNRIKNSVGSNNSREEEPPKDPLLLSVKKEVDVKPVIENTSQPPVTELKQVVVNTTQDPLVDVKPLIVNTTHYQEVDIKPDLINTTQDPVANSTQNQVEPVVSQPVNQRRGRGRPRKQKDEDEDYVFPKKKKPPTTRMTRQTKPPPSSLTTNNQTENTLSLPVTRSRSSVNKKAESSSKSVNITPSDTSSLPNNDSLLSQLSQHQEVSTDQNAQQSDNIQNSEALNVATRLKLIAERITELLNNHASPNIEDEAKKLLQTTQELLQLQKSQLKASSSDLATDFQYNTVQIKQEITDEVPEQFGDGRSSALAALFKMKESLSASIANPYNQFPTHILKEHELSFNINQKNTPPLNNFPNIRQEGSFETTHNPHENLNVLPSEGNKHGKTKGRPQTRNSKDTKSTENLPDTSRQLNTASHAAFKTFLGNRIIECITKNVSPNVAKNFTNTLPNASRHSTQSINHSITKNSVESFTPDLAPSTQDVGVQPPIALSLQEKCNFVTDYFTSYQEVFDVKVFHNVIPVLSDVVRLCMDDLTECLKRFTSAKSFISEDLRQQEMELTKQSYLKVIATYSEKFFPVFDTIVNRISNTKTSKGLMVTFIFYIIASLSIRAPRYKTQMHRVRWVLMFMTRVHRYNHPLVRLVLQSPNDVYEGELKLLIEILKYFQTRNIVPITMSTTLTNYPFGDVCEDEQFQSTEQSFMAIPTSELPAPTSVGVNYSKEITEACGPERFNAEGSGQLDVNPSDFSGLGMQHPTNNPICKLSDVADTSKNNPELSDIAVQFVEDYHTERQSNSRRIENKLDHMLSVLSGKSELQGENYPPGQQIENINEVGVCSGSSSRNNFFVNDPTGSAKVNLNTRPDFSSQEEKDDMLAQLLQSDHTGLDSLFDSYMKSNKKSKVKIKSEPQDFTDDSPETTIQNISLNDSSSGTNTQVVNNERPVLKPCFVNIKREDDWSMMGEQNKSRRMPTVDGTESVDVMRHKASSTQGSNSATSITSDEGGDETLPLASVIVWGGPNTDLENSQTSDLCVGFPDRCELTDSFSEEPVIIPKIENPEVDFDT